MANEQSIPLPQVDERYIKTLDAMISAPCLSIRAVLFSLYAEADAELKSRIEDLTHDFTITVQNLNAGIATPASELRTENEKATEVLTEEPTDGKLYCYICDDVFDPTNEGDLCYHHPGKRIANPDFDSVAYEMEVDPYTYNLKVEEGLDTEENRLLPDWACTWGCCGEPGGSRGCVQGIHEEYVEGMEEWDDSDSDESD